WAARLLADLDGFFVAHRFGGPRPALPHHEIFAGLDGSGRSKSARRRNLVVYPIPPAARQFKSALRPQRRDDLPFAGSSTAEISRPPDRDRRGARALVGGRIAGDGKKFTADL